MNSDNESAQVCVMLVNDNRKNVSYVFFCVLVLLGISYLNVEYLFQKSDNICLKCGGLSYFSSQPSMAHLTTLDKLSK